MRTALLSFLFISILLPVRCNPLLSTSLASEPPPPPLNTVPLPASGKMEVKWEPFRDIFENIIRPIGGEHDVAAMLENVKEEDIDTLEGTLLDKAKDDPEFVEQILTHLIHIRERYIKLRKDWQKTIEDRDKTAQIFKARIVDNRADPSTLLPANGQPVQFTQSFTPNTGATNVSPLLHNAPTPTPQPAPPRPVLTTVVISEQQQFTVSSHTLPDSAPHQFEDEEVEEDSGSFLGALPRPSAPSDFFFVPNHVIDPQIDPDQILFDTAIPQFATRGSPPAPPPHVAARRATAEPTTETPTTTTTQRVTRPWRFSSRATTTRRPETVPWWWTKTTKAVPTTTTTAPTTTTTTTSSPSTTQTDRLETKAGIHYDHTNNRTVYRYFWKPNDNEEAVIPEMIDENGNENSAVAAEIDKQTVSPIEEVPFEEELPVEEPPPPSPPTTTVAPTAITQTTTRRPPPPPTTQSTTPRHIPSRAPPTTADPQRPPRFEPVPEFAPRQPRIIHDTRFGLQQRQAELRSLPQQNRFHIPTGSRVFTSTKEVPQSTVDEEEFEQIPSDQHPLEPWAPTKRPTTVSTRSTITTSTAAPTTTTTPFTTTTTTTEEPTTTVTEETIPEVPRVPEFASSIEDISHFNDEFSEQSVDERELVNILNKEEEQRGVTEAKWFSGPSSAFDKEQGHLTGSPKRFIPEFPGEVDPQTFPEATQTIPERDNTEGADEPKHIVFTPEFVQPTTTVPSTTVEQTTVTPTTVTSSFIEETAEDFEKTTLETGEQNEDTTETFVDERDEVINETAEELSQAFAEFERAVSTRATEGPNEEPTEGPTEGPTEPPTVATTFENLVAAPQNGRPVIRQGVRAPTVVVWGRRPPKQPSTVMQLETAPPSIRPTKRPRKKTITTKIPDEISLLDELIREKTKAVEVVTTTQSTRSIAELEIELAREAKISRFFDEDARTTLSEDPHADAKVRGRTAGRKIRGKGMDKRVNTSQFFIRALNRDEHLSHEEARISLGLPGKASRPHSTPPSTTSAPSPTNDGVQLFDEHRFASCNAVKCDFEKDHLCQYESSLDELIFGDDAFRRRRKRSALDAFITVRAWTNWGGAKGDPALGNIALASGRTPSDGFSQGKNERFAGTQVNPSQMAMMSTQIDASVSLRILFDVWEGTRGVQLRVCCDAVCPFETELGVKKGSRNWMPREVTCPAGTRQLSFECTNTGKFRGACGVDNIRIDKC